MESKQEDLVELLENIGEAHHEEFMDVDGEDPEWARWYTEKMHAEFERLMGRSISVDGVADLLAQFSKLHSEEAPDEKWASYFARKLLDFYSD